MDGWRLGGIRRGTAPALLIGAGLFLAGCGGGADTVSGSGTGSPALVGAPGGDVGTPPGATLRVPQAVEPVTLDPAQVQDGPTIEFLMQVFEGLVQWNVENKLAPCLAESWDVSKDGRTYTFHLRKAAKFHNGRAVTSEDFVYSLTRSLAPKTASPVAMVYLNDIVGAGAFNAGTAPAVTGIKAPDAQTLVLTIDQPKAFFLAKLTYPTGYAICKEAIEQTGGVLNEKSLIGTGAFKLAEYRKGDRILLDANAEYWDGAPKIARQERRIVLDNQTRHDKFEAGELDLADVSMQTYRADRQSEKLKPLLKKFERPSIYYLALNQTAFPPFQNAKARQAFAHAVDKGRILREVHEGVPRQAEGIVPYGVPGYNPAFKGYPYDPVKAKQLLAEAGYPNGQNFPPLKIHFRAQMDDIKNTAVAIAAQLQENLGIQVQPEETEWALFIRKRNNGDMPFYFLRWMADYLDPQNFLSTMLRSGTPENKIGYRNPEFDRLCDAADVERDPKKRMELYHQAEKIGVADAPWVPIYFQADVELWNPKLQGVEDMLMGHLPHKRTSFAP